MTVAWILAPALFAAGYLTARGRRGRASQTFAQSPQDAVQDAARTSQHLHATIRQLEDQLAQFRHELQTSRPTDTSTSVASATDHPLVQQTDQLVQQLDTARVELHEHIRRLINAADLRFDPVTGLGSQREANRWMETLLALMARYGNQFSIAITAIDHSDNKTDRSEERTNRQLNELGQLLRRATRETDILARYSEDELLIILPETDESGAIIMAQRVRAQVARELDFSISIGVASALPGDSYKTLIHRADAALFTAQDQQGHASGCRHTGLEFEMLDKPEAVANESDGPTASSAECCAATAEVQFAAHR